MTLTKADLVRKLYESEVVTKAEAVEAVEAVIEIIKETLENGEDVRISRFGKFMVKDKRARRGRNPHTGEELILAPRRVVTFKPSGILRKKINGVDV